MPSEAMDHAASVRLHPALRMLIERFDEDPFLMFLLRGRSQEEIVTGLRARRAGPETEAVAVETEQPDELDLATFWSAPPQSETEEVALHFALPESDALPVKRLGPPSFVPQRDQGAFSVVMERLYLTRPTYYRRLHHGFLLVANRLDELSLAAHAASTPG